MRSPHKWIPSDTMQLFLLATVTSLLGSVGVGTNLGYKSPAFSTLGEGKSTDRRTLVAEEESWFASLLTIGALAGALGSGFAADVFGRKKTMIFSSVGSTLGWLLIGTAQDVIFLYCGRVVTGLFTGVVSLVVPLYISEVSRPDVRGTLGAGMQLSVAIGTLAVFLVGKYVNWSLLAFLCAIPTSLLTVLMLFIPESPRWLLVKGRREDALKSLNILFGKNIDHEGQCRAIEEIIGSSPRENFCVSELKQPGIYKPVLISLFLMFAQQLSGMNVVMSFAVSIFQQADPNIAPEDCMVIIGLAQVVAALVGTVVVDKSGRRVVLLLSVVLLGASLFVLGMFHYQKKAYGDSSVAHVGWLPLFCLSVFIVGFWYGMGPVPWLMMGELLPLRMLRFASSLCTGCNWALAFVVTKGSSFMVSALDAHGTYWFFAGVMALSFFVILATVPETKGKTLEQIEMTFRGVKMELDSTPESAQVVTQPVERPAVQETSSFGFVPSNPCDIEAASPTSATTPEGVAKQPDGPEGSPA